MNDTIKIQEFAVKEFGASDRLKFNQSFRKFMERHGQHEELAVMDKMSGRNRSKARKSKK
jgi:hypothetical protein